MPLNYEEDTNNEDEGMIGKLVNVARTNHRDSQAKIDENQGKVEAVHEELKKQIDQMQEKVDNKIDKKINEIKEELKET